MRSSGSPHRQYTSASAAPTAYASGTTPPTETSGRCPAAGKTSLTNSSKSKYQPWWLNGSRSVQARFTILMYSPVRA